jgi:hypothetical protein
MTDYKQSPDYGEPKDAWKTDLLAGLLVFGWGKTYVRRQYRRLSRPNDNSSRYNCGRRTHIDRQGKQSSSELSSFYYNTQLKRGCGTQSFGSAP